MKAIIETIEGEEYLTLIPVSEKEKNYLRNLWDRIPDISFDKRGSRTGYVPLKDHRFTIAIIKG